MVEHLGSSLIPEFWLVKIITVVWLRCTLLQSLLGLPEETSLPSPCLVTLIYQWLCLCGENNKRFCCFTSPLVHSLLFPVAHKGHNVTFCILLLSLRHKEQKVLFLSHSLRVQSIIAGKAWCQESGVEEFQSSIMAAPARDHIQRPSGSMWSGWNANMFWITVWSGWITGIPLVHTFNL